MRACLIAILAGLLLAVAVGSPHCQESRDACIALREQWESEFQTLKERIEELGRLKSTQLESAIQRELANPENARSIAGSVRAALKERTTLTDAAAQECRNAAERERMAFDRLRTCTPSERQRRSNTHDLVQNGDLRERKLVLSTLQELLLDEAYRQYKNYHAPTPPSYSDYGPQWGPGPGSGYDPYRANRGYR